MRLFTFQSPEVVAAILKDTYYALPEKSREQRDYKLDIEQLGGYYPIWAFAHVQCTHGPWAEVAIEFTENIWA